MRSAHRVSYAANVGEIPNGMFVLHKCDTPACVNPAHLFLGDARDNMVDATKKGRSSFARASAKQRAEWAQKRLAQEDGRRPDTARKGWILRRENGLEHTLTTEQSSERSRKTQATCRERYGKLGSTHSVTPEQRREAARKGWSDLTPEARAQRAKMLADARRRARESRPPRRLLFNLLAPRVRAA